MANDPNTRAYVDWVRPPGEQEGLSYYVGVIRERIRLVAAVVLVALAAGIAYLILTEDVYEGEAILLVTPVSGEDELLSSLGVWRASSDPTLDVETAATLATSPEIAERARGILGAEEGARSLQDRVKAEPLASSNLVAIIAEGSSPKAAADLANAFATAVVDDRTEALHDQIGELLPQLRQRLVAGGGGLFTESTLEADIGRLEVLSEAQDPTVTIEAQAVPPTNPVWPRSTLVIVGAVVAGLVLGIAGAFAVKNLDPRLRREEQLRSRYRLPILARVPRESSRRDRPLGPGVLTLQAREAYRTLRANVTAAHRNPMAAHSVLVTGSTPSEGKTTTALNLAGSLALAGNRVILIEADLRRPAIAEALGISVETGVVSTLLENVSIDEALTETSAFGPSLQLLLADYKGGWMSELFSLHAAQRLLVAAKARADYVIVDSPPLTSVVDTLPLARNVDDVLIVTRIGVTRVDVLPRLAELLASNRITPLGFVLIGAERTQSYYYQADDAAEVEGVPPTMPPGSEPPVANRVRDLGDRPASPAEPEHARWSWRRSGSDSDAS